MLNKPLNFFSLKNRYFFILILILFFVFWIWWLPGPRIANDFSYITNDWLKLQLDIPRVWNERGAEGLGEYSVFLLGFWPISFIFGAIAHIGMTFEIWERILIFLFIIIGSISIWKFLSQYSLSNKSKFIGSLFYLINTYPILLIDGGQISIALSYSLFPFAFLQVCQAVNSNLRKKVLAGLTVTFLGFFDIRFLYILFLLLFIKAVFDFSIKSYKRWINTLGIIMLLVVILNAYWLIAFLKVPVEGNIFASFTGITASLFNIGHPFLVISPHWYKNVFGQISQLRAEFILLPILAFAAPFFRRKNKVVLFWLSVAIFSIFLAKGESEPLSYVYPWLHANIPGFSFFRDSTKFFFLIALSYAVLISISVEEILIRLSSKKLAFAFLLILTGYLLYLIRPVFLNQTTGTLSVQPTEGEYRSLTNVLRSDNNFGRVFWIPGATPLSYSDLNHPIVEAARVYSRVPFTFGVKGAYEIFNFLREALYMGEIFDVAGVSYIAYPYPDTRRNNLSPDDIKYYYNFLSQITNLPWIERKIPESRIPLLKTKNHQAQFFITRNTWVTFGSDEVFREATKSAKVKLSNNAVILAESRPEMGSLITNFPEAKIVLNNKTTTDLIASFIPKSQIIFPARKLTVAPNTKGWWKNDGLSLIAWRDFLQSKYRVDNKDFDLGGGWAVGEGNLEFRIKNYQLRKNKILFARTMESSRSGKLEFYQGDKLIGNINTKAKENTVRWFEIGSLQSSEDLIIKTEGDINVINALALVDPEALLSYKKKTESLTQQINDYKPENAEDNNAAISYQKINQTKYKVVVSGLTGSQIIVSSSTFHPLWKLNGESSIPVYGFLNGFRVEKDGEYILEFEPQKYIYFGLLISGIMTICLSLFLLLERSSSRK